jgi:hypothetical protein
MHETVKKNNLIKVFGYPVNSIETAHTHAIFVPQTKKYSKKVQNRRSSEWMFCAKDTIS